MKICLASKFSPTYQGGLAAYERTLIRLLTQMPGIQVEVICSSQTGTRLPEAELGSSFSERMIPERRFASSSRAIRDRLASRPFTHCFLEKLLRASWDFPSTLNPDVIHFVGTGWDFFGFGLVHLAKKRKSRLTIWPAIHPGSWGDDDIDLRLYKQADMVLCQTEQERNHLQRLGLPRNKTIRCPMPPMCRSDGDPDRFRARHNLSDRCLVLFLGRRDQGKGFPSLLTAWRTVTAKFPEAVLVLAGPGQAESQELLDGIPAGTVCDLAVPDEVDKADALAACDVFCLASAHESFGIVYVEAWSYAKPVVCGPAPACREFIEDGRTGLWSSQNPDDLAEKLLLLLDNRQLREKIGMTGLALQRAHFNNETFLNVHLRAFGLVT
jgi:glycosyltransferase involved in cell wall biosynthesis